MKYKNLSVNDVRQKGDEVRSKATVNPGSAGPEIAIGKTTERDVMITNMDRRAAFRPCTLVGYHILQSDLIHLEYRRPTK